MSAPTVLFVAVGATRRQAVAGESRTLTEAGGRAIVVVGDRGPWKTFPFAPEVQVLTTGTTASSARWPVRSGQPLVSRTLRRVLNRLHRQVYRPIHARLRGGGDSDRLLAAVRAAGPYDAVVVSDPESFLVARRLFSDAPTPPVAYRLDQVLTR